MYDPNFPPNLDISPFALIDTKKAGRQRASTQDEKTNAGGTASDEDVWGQGEAIGQYGIAGRVCSAADSSEENIFTASWTRDEHAYIVEATTAMTTYLTPPALLTHQFDPPCPLFTPSSSSSSSSRPYRSKRIIELGSGQSVASLNLAQYLSSEDEMVLTDLPEVVPLCRRNIERYISQRTSRRPGEQREVGTGDLGTKEGEEQSGARLTAAPLPWGGTLEGLPDWARRPTHILLCDLIYFPQLYPPLLKTLLELTEQDNTTKDGKCIDVPDGDDEVYGPIIIMSYKPRTLENEQPFFDAISRYFRTTPVVSMSTPITSSLGEPATNENEARIDNNADTGRHDCNDSLTTAIETSISNDRSNDNNKDNDDLHDIDAFAPKLFIYQRWRTTPSWRIPPIEHIMSGVGVEGVLAGRDFGYTEQMFAALEWD